MKSKAKKWISFILRWGIAVVGIWLVVLQMSFRDRVWVIRDNRLQPLRLVGEAPDEIRAGQSFPIEGPSPKEPVFVSWDDTGNKPEKKTVLIKGEQGRVPLVAVDLRGDLNRKPTLNRLYVIKAGVGQWVTPDQLAERYDVRVPYPRVEQGLIHMIKEARGGLLNLAVMLFPIALIITSFRWNAILRALEIPLAQSRTFVLNMVGVFYNTFMLGSMGGDLLKAYYASKQTVHRTRAVMSVLVDRIIGLLALVILGGVMAAYQYFNGSQDDPASHACGRIAMVSALIVFGTAAGLFVYYHPALRKNIGLDWVLARLPRQKQIQNAMVTMDLLRKNPWVMFWSLMATFPVHIAIVFSAMCAGKAFGLTISPLYYFVTVPVIVLVGSIPISPQGAGVMEYFAILLLGRQGATVSQAFALTMSVRMVQIIWNLTGGVFVFRGGYHQPSEAEQQELETDTDDAPQPLPATATGS